MITVTDRMLEAARRVVGKHLLPDDVLDKVVKAAVAEIELCTSRELQQSFQVNRQALSNMIDRKDRNGMPDPVLTAEGGWRVWQADVMRQWRESYQPLVGRASPAWGKNGSS